MERRALLNRRWGYAILFCKFVINFVGAGIVKSFGVLIPGMVTRFHTSYATVGFICSLPVTLTFFSCPMVSLILEHIQYRPVALIGGVTSTICVVLCGFIEHSAALGVCLALTGVGLACNYMPSTLLLNDYFPEKFVLMNTITLYGQTAGASILPFIVERSFEGYGYTGTFFILGGITFNVVACAVAIRRPIVRSYSSETQPDDDRVKDLNQADEDKLKLKTAACGESKENRSEIAGKIDKRSNIYGTIGRAPAEGICDKTDTFTERDSSKEEQCYENDFNNQGMEINAEDLSLVRSTRHKDDIPKRPNNEPGFQEDHQCLSCFRALKFNILKEPLFLFNLSSTFLLGYTLNSWMLFLVPHTEQLGITKINAVFLSSIAGIGGIFGRTVFICLAARTDNIFYIYTGICAICTLSFLLDSTGSSYVIRAVLAFVQGYCFFSEDTMNFAFAKKTIVDPSNFSRAISLTPFAYGLGATAAGYFTGFLIDATKSYTAVFIILGIAQAIIAVNLVVTIVILRKRTCVLE